MAALGPRYWPQVLSRTPTQGHPAHVAAGHLQPEGEGCTPLDRLYSQQLVGAALLLSLNFHFNLLSSLLLGCREAAAACLQARHGVMQTFEKLIGCD